MRKQERLRGRPMSTTINWVKHSVRVSPSGSANIFFLVFVPFAASYYLSYFFRTINALVSSRLTTDFDLSARSLGFLTSVFFLSAFFQVPIGVLVDRHGPRRVQSCLLLVAAIGAAVFSSANEVWILVLGRALVGLGAGAAVFVGFKAIATWYPRERLALMNGCYVMVGALGAVTATAPAEMILTWIGWRGLFETFAFVTVICAALTFFIAPDEATGHPAPTTSNLKAVLCDIRLWRLAPLSTMCISTAWALQGLWAAPWMEDVEMLDRPSIVRHLFVMAVALSLGSLALGAGAHFLRKYGVRAQEFLLMVAGFFVAAELALILGSPISSYVLWAIIASLGGASVLTYAILPEFFPTNMIGQANAVLSSCHIAGAFFLQYVTGIVVNLWTSHGGHYPPLAYQAAFALIVILQIAAIIWFAYPVIRAKRRTAVKMSLRATSLEA
jgi:nitrate/nitrite transporter NarK